MLKCALLFQPRLEVMTVISNIRMLVPLCRCSGQALILSSEESDGPSLARVPLVWKGGIDRDRCSCQEKNFLFLLFLFGGDA